MFNFPLSNIFFGYPIHHWQLPRSSVFPGESILMCRPSEKQKVQELVNSDLRPVQSCLVQDNAGSGEETLCSSMKR